MSKRDGTFWVARDNDGTVWWFESEEPPVLNPCWGWLNGGDGDYDALPDCMMPGLNFSPDGAPIRVRLAVDDDRDALQAERNRYLAALQRIKEEAYSQDKWKLRVVWDIANETLEGEVDHA